MKNEISNPGKELTAFVDAEYFRRRKMTPGQIVGQDFFWGKYKVGRISKCEEAQPGWKLTVEVEKGLQPLMLWPLTRNPREAFKRK